MNSNNLPQNTPANNSRIRDLTMLTVIIMIGTLATAALIQNRGLNVEAQPDRIGLTLQPAVYPTPSITTDSDASPIVTAPGAQVEVRVTGPINQISAQASKRDGLSTHGAASPIVTGEGARVKAIVDTQL